MGEGTKITIGNAAVDFSSLTIDGPSGHSSIEPKIMKLLECLVDNAGEVVSRAELLEQVWGERYGGDESLSRGISLLRRAFGDTRNGREYIETVPKRGYRLVASVTQGNEEQAQTASHTAEQAIRSPSISQEKEKEKEGQQDARTLFGLRLIHALIALIVISILSYSIYLNRPATEQTLPVSLKGLANESGDLSLTVANNSIAVLPFEDLSAEGNQQYLADGIAEEILNELVKFPDLKVIGRTSSFGFRQRNPDLKSIRNTLNVTHALSGSVRRQGDRVRIAAKLFQTSDGVTIWAESYDGDLNKLLDLQANFAKEIAMALGGIMQLDKSAPLAPRLTDDKQAYMLFVQGRAMARKFGHRSKLKAKELLEKAIERDPEFASAWAWLAQAELYLTLSASAENVPNHLFSAQQAAEKSVLLNSDLAMGHYVHSILYEYNQNFSKATDSMEKAYQLNPAQPFFAIRRGVSRSVLGLSNEGSKLIEAGLLLDPTDAIGLYNLGVAQYSMGFYSEAKKLIQRSIDLGFQPGAIQLCMILTQQNEPSLSKNCWLELPDGVKNRFGAKLSQAEHWERMVLAVTTDDAAARQRTLALIDEHYLKTNSKPTIYTLIIYLAIGEPERFMNTFINHPFAFNAGAITGVWNDSESSRKLRAHPRFAEFADRIGLVDAWRVYGWPDKCQKASGTADSGPQFSCQ